MDKGKSKAAAKATKADEPAKEKGKLYRFRTSGKIENKAFGVDPVSFGFNQIRTLTDSQAKVLRAEGFTLVECAGAPAAKVSPDPS